MAASTTNRRSLVALYVILDGKGAALMEWREDFCPGGGFMYPGGKVEEGESSTEAMHREAREELGVSVTKACALPEIMSGGWDVQAFLVSKYTLTIGRAYLPPATLDKGDVLIWRSIRRQVEDSRWGPSQRLARLIREHVDDHRCHPIEAI